MKIKNHGTFVGSYFYLNRNLRKIALNIDNRRFNSVFPRFSRFSRLAVVRPAMKFRPWVEVKFTPDITPRFLTVTGRIRTFDHAYSSLGHR